MTNLADLDPACPDLAATAQPACATAGPAAPAGLRAATLAVRGGLHRTAFQETSEPLFLTQGFVYDHAAEAEAAFAEEIDRYTYSRYTNPTVTTFEERLALIEGAEDCYAQATGMSAVFNSVAALVSSGSRIVAARELFGSTLCVFDDVLARWGVRTDYVTGTDLDQWATALATPADVVFLESPSNPMQDVLDLPAIARLAHAAGAVVIVDNVFATPVLQKPLELGADVVVYSATKHIDGQGRVMGGAVLGSKEYVRGSLQALLRATGPTLAPFNAWVLAKGLETMPIRVKAATATALDLAGWLEDQPGVGSVRYPFLRSHPQHQLARAQMTGGGTVVTFTLDGAAARRDTERTFAFLDALRVIDISNNLGDAKSMVTHPATTTHRRIDPVTRHALGIEPTTVRFSVGLEDVEDLREDLDAALRVFRG
ncbi:O-succinylhomoserine sulfhydrylase [Georgenia yuyongxinii]|uniref:O-succinylhomoserine sulfhydrylase n=1 Tax=Georgenia yuyongxinii TaxID=2589797 RepID=A0A552WWT3_9MICO|nr:O-succinylhomoserine sulfhydrylase [Georgenia yuyongxinii]TRW47234.1 O-succinylhomoserine sulfhydrylase [Georgenia yuyongxinii]